VDQLEQIIRQAPLVPSWMLKNSLIRRCLEA